MSNFEEKVFFQTRLLFGAFHVQDASSDISICEKQTKSKSYSLPLRCYARLAVLCIRLCKDSFENLARARGEYESVMQVLDEYGVPISWGGLTFSPENYRATKQHCLNAGARRLLQQNPSSRTENNINLLLVVLRNIPAFAQYPKKMQYQLCKVGCYERYEPRRVVLREGHPPRAFYFILSGTVLVTALDEKTRTSRTLVALTKGMSFGELAVVANRKRQATVCSKSEIELLSIPGEEFEKIFMAGGRNVLVTKKQKQFTRSVAFLRHWPVDKLKGNAQACTVYYFDRHQVLVRDSNNSDWIYIVLKGSLSVVKKLQRVDAQPVAVTPRKTIKVFHRETKQKYLNLGRCTNSPSQHDCDHIPVNNVSIDKLTADMDELVFKSQFELESKLEQTLPGYHNPKERLGCLDYDKIITAFRSRLSYKAGHANSLSATDSRDTATLNESEENILPNLDIHETSTVQRSSQDYLNPEQRRGHCIISLENSSFLPDISQTNKVIQTNFRIHGDQNGTRTDTRNPLQDDNEEEPEFQGMEVKRHTKKRKILRKTSKGVYLAPTAHRTGEWEHESESIPHTPETPSSQDYFPRVKTSKQENTGETISEMLARMQLQYQRRVLDCEGRKTIAEQLDHKARRDLKFTEVDLDPAILEVQVLERGQYFGVAQLLFPDQPTLSLISNGAECLVMSKKLFMQWATDKCLRHLRHTENPYPSDKDLCRKLQDMVNWQAARAHVYRDLVSEIDLKKAKRKQYLPQCQGQYCFRTGLA